MSDLEPVPEGVRTDRGEADLAAAARQLRAAAPSSRMVEIAGRVLGRTLATPRRATLVRARPPYDYLQVSTLVITTTLRAHLDAHLVGAAVGRVVVDTDPDHHLAGLTVELYVQYGRPVLVAADQARELARGVLADVLGLDPGAADGDAVVVAASHVHVSDVTVGDPHLVDPADER